MALSGLTKQDYIIRRLQCRDVVVQGNPRVFKALRNQMEDIYEELKRLECCSEAIEKDRSKFSVNLIDKEGKAIYNQMRNKVHI